MIFKENPNMDLPRKFGLISLLSVPGQYTGDHKIAIKRPTFAVPMEFSELSQTTAVFFLRFVSLVCLSCSFHHLNPNIAASMSCSCIPAEDASKRKEKHTSTTWGATIQGLVV